MVRITLAALVSACALFSATAQAQQSPAVEADVRCLLLGLTIANVEGATAQQQQAGTLIATYYVGRIQGRAPTYDLSAGMQAQARALTPELVTQEQQRCSAEFRAVGTALQTAMRSVGGGAAAPTP